MKIFNKLIKIFLFIFLCVNSFTMEEKIYKIATDIYFPPFEFEDKDGNFKGIDVELLKFIAEDQNFKYELLPLGFQTSMNALDEGEVDAIFSGMSISEERKKKYDFSDPYIATGIALAVEENTEINSYEDLKGKVVTVKRGTTGCKFVEKISKKYEFSILYLDDEMNLVEDVAKKMSDACFEDIIFIEYNIANGMNIKIPLGEEDYSECAVMVRKNENKELLEKINRGLKNLKENGIYDKIIYKYLKK